MVKPEQQLFIAGFRICPQGPYFRPVLFQCITARDGAVESYAGTVSFMVIDRIPFRSCLVVDPWGRTIMMTRSHDMMQSDRIRIPDNHFTAFEHERYCF